MELGDERIETLQRDAIRPTDRASERAMVCNPAAIELDNETGGNV